MQLDAIARHSTTWCGPSLDLIRGCAWIPGIGEHIIFRLAVHEYPATHARIVELTLRGCGKPEHRRAAAEILGYATQSGTQINELVHASRDMDDRVCNNAISALWVLATSKPKMAARIPADQFIEMLNSGTWEDRNKARWKGSQPIQSIWMYRFPQGSEKLFRWRPRVMPLPMSLPVAASSAMCPY